MPFLYNPGLAVRNQTNFLNLCKEGQGLFFLIKISWTILGATGMNGLNFCKAIGDLATHWYFLNTVCINMAISSSYIIQDAARAFGPYS